MIKFFFILYLLFIITFSQKLGPYPADAAATTTSQRPLDLKSIYSDSGITDYCNQQLQQCQNDQACSRYLKEIQACTTIECVNALPEYDQLYLNLWQCITANQQQIAKSSKNQGSWSRLSSYNSTKLYQGNGGSMKDALGDSGLKAIQTACGKEWDACQADGTCAGLINSALACTSNQCLSKYQPTQGEVSNEANAKRVADATAANSTVQTKGSLIQNVGMCILQNHGCIVSAAANVVQYKWIVNVVSLPYCKPYYYWYWPYWGYGHCCCSCNQYPYYSWWWYGDYWGGWWNGWWKGCYGYGWWGWWGWYGWYPGWGGQGNGCCCQGNYWYW